MANRNPEQKARTRGHIMNAFWRLYESEPIEKITVRSIVALAGCNRSTFYEYFVNPMDVLEVIEDELIEKLARAAEENLRHADTVDPASIIADVYGKNASHLKVLLSPTGDPAFAQRLKDRVIPLLACAMGDKDIIADGRANRGRYVYEFAVSGVLAMMTLWYERGCDIPAATMAELIYAIMQHGPYAVLRVSV